MSKRLVPNEIYWNYSEIKCVFFNLSPLFSTHSSVISKCTYGQLHLFVFGMTMGLLIIGSGFSGAVTAAFEAPPGLGSPHATHAVLSLSLEMSQIGHFHEPSLGLNNSLNGFAVLAEIKTDIMLEPEAQWEMEDRFFPHKIIPTLPGMSWVSRDQKFNAEYRYIGFLVNFSVIYV